MDNWFYFIYTVPCTVWYWGKGKVELRGVWEELWGWIFSCILIFVVTSYNVLGIYYSGKYILFVINIYYYSSVRVLYLFIF